MLIVSMRARNWGNSETLIKIICFKTIKSKNALIEMHFKSFGNNIDIKLIILVENV